MISRFSSSLSCRLSLIAGLYGRDSDAFAGAIGLSSSKMAA